MDGTRPRKTRPLADRIWSKVEKTPSCWLWHGCIKPSGHGQIQEGPRGGRRLTVHDAVYELLVGPVAADDVLHHKCGVKNCVNLGHLLVVARADHPMLHPDNISTSAALRARGSCTRWRVNRGRPCVCGTHDQRGLMQPWVNLGHTQQS
jgi:hypothetical protein